MRVVVVLQTVTRPAVLCCHHGNPDCKQIAEEGGRPGLCFPQKPVNGCPRQPIDSYYYWWGRLYCTRPQGSGNAAGDAGFLENFTRLLRSLQPAVTYLLFITITRYSIL